MNNDWQPIESAPKDRSLMLYGSLAGEINGVYAGEYICIGEWTGRSDYVGYDWSCDNTDAYAVWCKPTYWMPLPHRPELEA